LAILFFFFSKAPRTNLLLMSSTHLRCSVSWFGVLYNDGKWPPRCSAHDKWPFAVADKSFPPRPASLFLLYSIIDLFFYSLFLFSFFFFLFFFTSRLDFDLFFALRFIEYSLVIRGHGQILWSMVSAKDFDAPEWNTKVLLGTPLLFPPKPILPPLFFSPVIYGKYVTLYRICVIPPGYFPLRHLNDVDTFLLYTQNTRKSNAAAIYLFIIIFFKSKVCYWCV
jgi:hypothetical protein